MPRSARLNARISPTRPLLLATLDILWEPPDVRTAMTALEDALLTVSSRFARHQCRGAEAYHVFSRPRASGAADSVEGPLALAHLIEHATIDFQCTLGGDDRCSGATAAHRAPPGRYDVFVECGEAALGRCSLALAITWLTRAAGGQPLGGPEKDVLAAGGLVHRRIAGGVSPGRVARRLGWPEPRAHRALALLSQVGYLEEIPWTVNLGGDPEYRVCLVDA